MTDHFDRLYTGFRRRSQKKSEAKELHIGSTDEENPDYYRDDVLASHEADADLGDTDRTPKINKWRGTYSGGPNSGRSK